MATRGRPHHPERHLAGRSAWLRAAVLGANDAIVSNASLMLGVAASGAPREAILIAGMAGMAAGAMSMAAGEYVSVSSQRDTERADIERERRELEIDPQGEQREIVSIYERRGLTRELAQQVAQQLSAGDRLETHLRDELGIDPAALARPLQAAWISAASFGTFALVPIVALLIAPASLRIASIATLSLASLGALGALGGHLGGAPRGRAAVRVLAGGVLAMLLTFAIGKLFGVALQ